MASYKYADLSVPSSSRAFLVFEDDYYNFIGEYPESKYRKELDSLHKIKQKIMKLSVALSSISIYIMDIRKYQPPLLPRCQGTREAYGQSLRNRSDNLEESQSDSIGGRRNSIESLKNSATNGTPKDGCSRIKSKSKSASITSASPNPASSPLKNSEMANFIIRRLAVRIS